MTKKRERCPISGIYCDECGILQNPELAYCPIVSLIEFLEETLPTALENLSKRE